MKAYLIDADSRKIIEVSYETTDDLRNFVGGSLELAYAWANGDTLYVDEEGLFREPQEFFAIETRPDQPLAGNGILVGRELPGRRIRNADPAITLPELELLVSFGMPVVVYIFEGAPTTH